MSGDDQSAHAPTPPLLRVVRGAPTPEEIAALVAVLSARASSTPTGSPSPRSAWGRPAARVREPLRPGPGAWRASGRSR
ncbi:acyl-CoA carboxylase subunit epsilon [Spiractinospora alimapuensis]|uniref:acyl-CoA carboxylase subunit epsilon n=1 Tax=Spiractinospora alimapuensis TaxID=2820884 RepID=UPI001F355C87|nr:acyl-CoA carboxylase subunit epsilon [Spiractinospora alimapuensis]QVQ51144.1 acyl-CoA carboxylase subunit epsilon [Spiractinospora alimapuensis]